MSTSTRLVTGVDFVTVPTRDLDTAIDFYGNVLGLEPGPLWGSENPVGAEFETGNLTIALMANERLGIPFRATAAPIEFRVDDVPAARAELESRGVEFVGDVIDSGVCHQLMFRDPDGNALALHHRYVPRR